MTSAARAWAWHHTGLSVENLSQALSFYKDSFGFTPVFEAMDMSDLIENLTGIKGLRADLVQCKSPISNQVLELIKFRNIPDSFDELLPLRPGRMHNAFLVPDLEAAIEAVVKNGGRLFGAITEFSEGRAAYLTDGSGNAIELEEATEGSH